MDRVSELKSFSDNRAPNSSPITPAYIRFSGANRKEAKEWDDDVEDACRSFENYLIEMIVEEGKTRDLVDVEELLYCWKNLRCPVFTDIVCRFYGELCKDLFSNSTEKHPTYF
ncbi:hypothetical protein ACS0TY_014913 [Phlomoides rotata]